MTSTRKPIANVRRGEPMILFAVGPHTMAIAAAEVDEIRDMHGLKPMHGAIGYSRIKSTLHRGKRDYFVVDAASHFRMLPSKPARLLVLRNHPVALATDSIDRMTEVLTISPLPSPFSGLEREWYTGLAVLDGSVIPVINAKSFLSQAEASELSVRMKGAAS